VWNSIFLPSTTYPPKDLRPKHSPLVEQFLGGAQGLPTFLSLVGVSDPLFVECFLFDTRQTPPLCRVFFLPSVFRIALGKEFVYRVPYGMHSANIKILGKFEVSGSAINQCPLVKSFYRTKNTRERCLSYSDKQRTDDGMTHEQRWIRQFLVVYRCSVLGISLQCCLFSRLVYTFFSSNTEELFVDSNFSCSGRG